MNKPFEEITEAGFELLQQILEQPGTLPSDFYFDEPTVDGQVDLLLKSNLVVFDNDEQLSITELGRAALKHHDYIMEQNALIQKQRTEELESFKFIANSIASQADSAKAIANNAAKQAETAEKQSEKAGKTSKGANFRANLSIIISILSFIVAMLANADKIVHNIQKILSYLNMPK